MLQTEAYQTQRLRWPKSGRHILAQHDADSVVVYQAYKPAIALPAARAGRFGLEWSRSRMTWIKPNFLWMMYRSGWATKADQEVILAIRMSRSGFDHLLEEAVHSTFNPDVYEDEQLWKAAVSRSDVRLQWDPDHHPSGAPAARRAIQLGLRGRTLERFAESWILAIEDVTAFVREQRTCVVKKDLGGLITPRETVYPVADEVVVRKLQIDRF